MDYLNKLMYWRGIGNSYFNYRGENIEVSWDNRLALLRAMGLDLDDVETQRKNAYDLDVAPWQQWLRSLTVSFVNHDTVNIPINVMPEELDQSFEYILRLEHGKVIRGEFCPSDFEEIGDYNHQNIRYSCRNIIVPLALLGYHEFEVVLGDKKARSYLVVAPQKAFSQTQPKSSDTSTRPWGLIIQLYTLRSHSNWGIGDFSDLRFLIEKAASFGVDAIGLNPLHALKHPVKDNFSPYSPSDRRFLCPLYIDPSKEPEFNLLTDNFDAQKECLREPPYINYEHVHKLKYSVYDRLFQLFCLEATAERKNEFLHFKQSHGQALEEFALFQHLDEVDLLEALNTPKSKAEALDQYKDDVEFQCYLQWLAFKQLNECQALCLKKGMSIGLIRDLAVGANGGGAEVQLSEGLFCTQSSVGAPPDPLAEKGQNWGLPPIDPVALKQTNFKHFIQLLRDNMSACGALRIDHAMSLLRLWWCPPMKTADYGAYVYYPFHEMLGLLKLESIRNNCLVVGEDMGVVPPELRQSLIDGGILTNKLFYFEKNNDDSFKSPEHYDVQSMAMLTNHDVPTLASWWNTTDLQLRNRLDQLEEGVTLEQVLQQRELEKKRLLDWLVAQGFLDREPCDSMFQQAMTTDLMQKIMICASRCASQLFVLQIEDLELMDLPVNVPGTSTEYPNWQRKIARNLSDIFDDPFVKASLTKISAQRQQII